MLLNSERDKLWLYHLMLKREQWYDLDTIKRNAAKVGMTILWPDAYFQHLLVELNKDALVEFVQRPVWVINDTVNELWYRALSIQEVAKHVLSESKAQVV